MGGIIRGIIGGVGGLIGGSSRARREQEAAERGAEQSLTGFNFATGSPLNEQILGAGGQASDLRSSLLGLTDPAAGQAALEQFQRGTGFQSRLKTGREAITGGAATQGLLESGGTLKGLNRFGQDLAQGSFNQFLGQLGDVTGQGIQAGGIITGAGTAGGGAAGRALQTGGNLAAGSRAQGFADLAAGAGQVADTIFARRAG